MRDDAQTFVNETVHVEVRRIDSRRSENFGKVAPVHLAILLVLLGPNGTSGETHFVCDAEVVRWVLAGVTSLVVLLVAVFAVVPEAGGPRPGRLFDRTTTEECRTLLDGSKRAQLHELSTGESGPIRVSAQWVWSSRGYGWGCQFEYPGGAIERTPPGGR